MPIDRIFVAGAGLMGHGIGQVHAAIGKHVTLYEPDLARAQAGRERIAANLDRAVAKGKIDSDQRDATHRPDPGDGRPRARPIGGSRRRGGVRGPRRQARALVEARRARARGDHLRVEHELDLDRSAGRGGLAGAARAVRRHALLQPGAGDAAGRADPRDRDVGRHRGRHPRADRCARQEAHRVRGPARVHRQPHPDAAPRRGDAHARGGNRDGRRHRHGSAESA